jgi:type II secretory pathway component PulK
MPHKITFRFIQEGSHGAALVLVLVTLLAVSSLVLYTTEITSRRFADASRLVLEYKAGLKADASLDKALELLAHMIRTQDDPDQGYQNALWEEHGVRITITPCSAKIELNGLAKRNKGSERLHRALLDILGPEDISTQELENLLYWMRDKRATMWTSDQNFIQTSSTWRNLHYKAPGRPLQRPEEIMLIPGFSHLSPDWIRHRFTTWGQPGRINLNFASREIVLSFLPELEAYWDQIATFRRDTGLTHPNQLLSAIGMDIDTYSQLLPFLTWEAANYEIVIQSREGEWLEIQRYIVQLDPMNPNDDLQVKVRDIIYTGT